MTLKTVLTSALVTATVALLAIFWSTSQTAQGSVPYGNEYDYTVATSGLASGVAITQIKNGQGSLGSVVVTQLSGDTTYPQITLYDATSTMATSSSRIIARFSTTTVALDTYTFDVAFTKGLSVEVAPGYAGAATITYR